MYQRLWRWKSLKTSSNEIINGSIFGIQKLTLETWVEEPVRGLPGTCLRGWLALCVQHLPGTHGDGCIRVCTCVWVYGYMYARSPLLPSPSHNLPIAWSNPTHFTKLFWASTEVSWLWTCFFFNFYYVLLALQLSLYLHSLLNCSFFISGFTFPSELDCLFPEGVSCVLHSSIASARSWAQLCNYRVKASWVWGSERDWSAQLVHPTNELSEHLLHLPQSTR